MTRQEASQAALHYRCGGRLQVAQQFREGSKTIWIVGVRCVKCKRKAVTRGPYRRWFEGEEAMADRRQLAIASFNQGVPWEEDI
ncbi:MAG: hypothetical protein H0U76_10585 [Ktedonobacteraceae bacterium]|nr:hypothetical protein [Ktedonobacteraceae bacterium]